MKISIIIPVLNEERTIVEHLKRLRPLMQEHEVIVVDGGSSDATVALAKPMASQLVESGPGRAKQMNAGAARASGDVFLFLHADTVLPDGFAREIDDAMSEGYDWGRFDVRLSGSSAVFRVIEWFINGRSRHTGIATGDQAIFVCAEQFRRVAGFPEQPLMEDIELSARLKTFSAPCCSRLRVLTSSRRWETYGVIRTVLLMWYLRAAYFLGARPESLARLYR